MKKLIPILIIFIFCSCTHVKLNSNFIITKQYRVNSYLCEYDIVGSNEHSTRVYFIDTCYKYSVGDTVSFKPIK